MFIINDTNVVTPNQYQFFGPSCIYTTKQRWFHLKTVL